MFPIIPQHLRVAIDAFPSTKISHFSAGIPRPVQSCPAKPSGVRDSDGPRSGVASWESECRLMAAEDIGCDVVSEEFAAECLLTERDSVQGVATRHVTLSRGGRLSCSSWVRLARLSADCHSCNVLLQRGVEDPNKLRLQVIRPLRAGDELHMWFAQPTLAALAVPFLRPANIHGDNRYVCHHCLETFETPNPLKLHLALGCLPIDKNRLYSRLIAARNTARHPQVDVPNRRHSPGVKPEPEAIDARTVHIKPEPREGFTSDIFAHSRIKSEPIGDSQRYESNRKHEQMNVTNKLSSTQTQIKKEQNVASKRHHTNMKQEPAGLHYHPDVKRPRTTPSPTRGHRVSVHSLLVPASRLGDDTDFRLEVAASSPTSTGALGTDRAGTGSAFRPYWKPREGGEVDRRSPDERAQVGSFHPVESAYFAQAREMETLVSNLGRSKHGHLCVYCGKVYSRKYGLKIHIRTHTGFKPLQCRHCLRPFGDPSNLNKHVRLHAEGSTPYKCDLCGKVLVRRRDLERHIKSRHSNDAVDASDS